MSIFLVAGSVALATTGVAFVIPFSFLVVGCIAWDFGLRPSLLWIAFVHVSAPCMLALLGQGPFFLFAQARGVIAAIMVFGVLAALTIALVVGRLRRLNEQLLMSRSALVRANEDLHSALDEVKELRGLLPICASCKDIREEGKWEKLESYLSRNSRATFSHGLCPKCLDAYLRQIPERCSPAIPC